MRDNKKSFESLSRRLGRKISHCEECGKDIMNTMWRISYKDHHNILPEHVKVLCVKCFK